MTLSPDEARAKVDAARASYQRKAAAATSGFEALMREGLNGILQRLIETEPEVITGLAPADRTALKLSFNESVESAANGIRGIVTDVQLDRATKHARRNSSGDRFIQVVDRFDALIAPPLDLLQDAGFNVGIITGRGTYSKPKIQDLPNSTQFSVLERQLDEPAEAYGKAKRDLEAAELAIRAGEAKSAWDEA